MIPKPAQAHVEPEGAVQPEQPRVVRRRHALLRPAHALNIALH